MRDCYDAGYCSVWNWTSCRPQENIPERDFSKAYFQFKPYYTQCKESYMQAEKEWLEGYDAGLKQVETYNSGLSAGLNGDKHDSCIIEDRNQRTEWHRGWYEGYRQFLRKKLKPIVKAAPKLDLVVVEHHYGDYDDREGIEYPPVTKYKKLKKSELLESVVNYLSDRYGRETPVDEVKDLETIKKLYLESGESDYGCVNLITVKEMKKQKSDAEYSRMEKAAQRFAGTCGKKMGTMEFLRALDKAVNGVRYKKERWNDGETRMEEWAACMYSGAGRETYFDDLNYVNGKYETELDDLHEVYNYIERKFPLLFMKYQEWKMRKKNATQ